MRVITALFAALGIASCDYQASTSRQPYVAPPPPKPAVAPATREVPPRKEEKLDDVKNRLDAIDKSLER